MDKMKYINSKGETVSFGDGNILLDNNDVRDYEWSFNSLYKKIVGFERKTSKRKLKVLIYGKDARSTADIISGIFEADIEATKPGRLYIGDYYCNGYIYGSTKKDYNKDGILLLELKFVTDESKWIKEEVTTKNQNSPNLLENSKAGQCFIESDRKPVQIADENGESLTDEHQKLIYAYE